MARRRVCIVRHGYYPGEARVRREAEALAERGYEVDVICLRGRSEAARERIGGVEVHRLPVSHRRAGIVRYLFEYSAFFVLAAKRLTRLFLRAPYVVVQVHTMPDFLVFAALVPKLLGARVVLDMQEVMPELYASKFGASRGHPLVRAVAAVERASTSFADRVITVSEPIKRPVLARGVPQRKVSVVMNSADERIFAARPKPTPGDNPWQAPLLVTHGTLIEHYGFETAIRAMPPLLRRVPRARLQIIGDGEHRRALQSLASDLGVAAAVEFLGHLPLEEIPSRLARAQVGIVPNEAPYFLDLVVPTKLMEYVTMRVPAVVPRSRAVEAYFDESMVRFFTPRDPEDLARAVSDLCAHPGNATSMAQRAAAGFLPKYGWEKMRERYVDLIDEVAKETGSRRWSTASAVQIFGRTPRQDDRPAPRTNERSVPT